MLAAIRSYRAKFFVFQGRATLGEMWWVVLAWFLLGIACGLIDVIAKGRGEFVFGVCSLVGLIPNIALSVRRLHDTNRSGWWLLLSLVPVIGLVLVVFYLQPGTRGENRFGPDPRQSEAVFASI